jgi:hypothetical protein
MELVTERSRIKTVAEQWDAMYGPNFRTFGDGISSKAISEKLHALNLSKVSANTVNKIIGNDSWTRLVCDASRKPVTKVAVLYHPGDGSAVVEICESCATKVKTLFKTGVAR